MSHRFGFDSSRALRAARHMFAGAALVALGYVAALAAPLSIGVLRGHGSGGASDAGAMASSAVVGHRPVEEAASAGSSRRDFDYFPDHYINQAREVAEQPPTF